MANALYPKIKEALLQGDVALDTDTVKVALVDTGAYTYSSAHQYLSSLTGITATSGALASKTFTNGTFDSADPVFTAATGAVSEALVLYVDTGTAGTSRLIAYYDTGVTGLPVTPNGGDINVQVNAAGWFTL